MTTRTYTNDSIRVVWDSSLCIHTGLCIRAGEGVFDPTRRPWIKLELADTDTIVNAVETCPTGALVYERIDDGDQEKPAIPTTVVPWPNGPLFVRGNLEVTDRHGETFLAGPRAALCRCGESRNQPFCDLSHREAGFRDYPRVSKPERDAAECPDDISPTVLT